MEPRSGCHGMGSANRPAEWMDAELPDARTDSIVAVAPPAMSSEEGRRHHRPNEACALSARCGVNMLLRALTAVKYDLATLPPARRLGRRRSSRISIYSKHSRHAATETSGWIPSNPSFKLAWSVYIRAKPME